MVGSYAWPAPPEARIVALGVEHLQAAVAQVAADRADAPAVAVLKQVGGEPLLVAIDLLAMLHQLLVEHVQDRVAGDVRHVVGARGRGATEGAGAEVAGLVAMERDAGVLEPQDLVRGLAAHDLDRVLVAEVVRALDGVERVRLPAVLGIQCRVDAAGCGDRVRADRMDLRDDRHRGPGLGRGERCALAGQSCTDDQNVN